ncbi:MAG: putative beta sliding clamp [Prokaryotic dsDNA virus sp.]|nr:MAG: putative beta sliding clamp [Prokaryotic dsDNA virus sp.]|tara:strand:+ start:9212 stop:10366 length:1155 start_codon:yes stop_codon:yes gene_type:complete
MKFTCETKAFNAAMAVAGRVIPVKSPVPILTHIKMVTNDNRVTLVGTDGDTTFEMDVPATVQTEGAACIPFATLTKFVSAAKATEVTIDMADSDAKVSSGRNRITLQVMDTRDYPNYRRVEGDLVTVDAPAFCHALRFCTAAASTEETRYYLCGAFFDEADEYVTAWGTNGNVAHRAEMTGITTVGGGGIVPNAAALTILGVAEKQDTVKVIITDMGWSVDAGAVRVWGKVIDGTFPNMRQMMSQFPGWSNVATVDHAEMTNGIDVAGCGADIDSTKARSLILKCEQGGGIILRGGRPIGGVLHAGRAEVDASVTASFAGSFNAKLIRDAMVGLKVNTIAIDRAEAGGRDIDAIQIKPAQADATVQMSATILGMRATEAELADV